MTVDRSAFEAMADHVDALAEAEGLAPTPQSIRIRRAQASS